ncbi:hypothetical protein DLM46_36695 [Paraburkholderia lacunae]|uniref:Uncharacterized protein n=1 Tax=Paraburkholderia lacunae TaxID=2211104 RepID=A0A370MWA6_9BURK|nr:hypothetical protein DLM46_36695 [Paraburkholderia lacunae]
MTIQDAIFRAAALAVVLYAMNRLRQRRGVADITPKSKVATTQRVAGLLTGLVITTLVVYSLRHQIAATFHIQ